MARFVHAAFSGFRLFCHGPFILSFVIACLKLKLHRRTAAGLNIHRYALCGGGSCVNGILLANPGAVFGEGAPGPTPLLERL